MDEPDHILTVEELDEIERGIMPGDTVYEAGAPPYESNTRSNLWASGIPTEAKTLRRLIASERLHLATRHAERERCAKIAEAHCDDPPSIIAAEIRDERAARGVATPIVSSYVPHFTMPPDATLAEFLDAWCKACVVARSWRMLPTYPPTLIEKERERIEVEINRDLQRTERPERVDVAAQLDQVGMDLRLRVVPRK